MIFESRFLRRHDNEHKCRIHSLRSEVNGPGSWRRTFGINAAVDSFELLVKEIVLSLSPGMVSEED